MKPTLVVLAAGMGSRYGSLKQMDGVGPNGEAIIDYSIYDAVRAGFGKVVFIIRHSFEKEFREIFSTEHFGGKVETEYVFQELEYLPEGFSVPEGREKPWGTCHAVMMAEPVVDTPFAVINADDFYGQRAYRQIRDFLENNGGMCMVGYRLGNTLTENGTVAGNLVSIVERTAIERVNGGQIMYKDADGLHPLDENTVVSMNLFGFTPDFFAESETLFRKFLSDPANMANPKAEFFIPLCVNQLINDGKVSLKVLNSDAQWFGVTYKQDKPYVVERIQKLIEAGVYPEHLWM